MDFSNLTPFESIFIIIVLVIAIIAVGKGVRNYLSKANNPEELLNYIVSDFMKDVMPIVTAIVFKHDIIGSGSVEEFKENCTDSVAEDIYKYLEQNKNKIPENLRPFLSIELCTKAVKVLFTIPEVDEILRSAYDKKQKAMLAEMEEEEKKAAKIIAETGVEDETLLERDPVGSTEELVDLEEEEEDKPSLYI